VRLVWLVLAIVVTTLAAVLIASVLVNPALPSLSIRPVSSLPHSADLKPKPLPVAANPIQQKAKKAQAELQRALAATTRVVPAKRRSQTPVAPPPPKLPAPIVSNTRPLSVGFYVNWDESSLASLERNTEAVATVNSRLFAATRPDASASDLYKIATEAYAELGFADEIDKHHQGGACGYRTRDWNAHSSSSETAKHHQAFAWNPSITGTKIEETGIVTESGFEVITATPGFPQISVVVDGREYISPGILSL